MKVLVIVLSLIMTASQPTGNRYYFNNAVVVEKSAETGTILTQTMDGNIWRLKNRGFQIEDGLLFLMDNKGTVNIEDDEIVLVSRR